MDIGLRAQKKEKKKVINFTKIGFCETPIYRSIYTSYSSAEKRNTRRLRIQPNF